MLLFRSWVTLWNRVCITFTFWLALKTANFIQVLLEIWKKDWPSTLKGLQSRQIIADHLIWYITKLAGTQGMLDSGKDTLRPRTENVTSKIGWRMIWWEEEATKNYFTGPEGFVRRSNREFIQFLFISISSAAELQSHMYVALDQRYVTRDIFDLIYQQADKTAKMISGLITYLRKNDELYKQSKRKKPEKPKKP